MRCTSWAASEAGLDEEYNNYQDYIRLNRVFYSIGRSINRQPSHSLRPQAQSTYNFDRYLDHNGKNTAGYNSSSSTKRLARDFDNAILNDHYSEAIRVYHNVADLQPGHHEGKRGSHHTHFRTRSEVEAEPQLHLHRPRRPEHHHLPPWDSRRSDDQGPGELQRRHLMR